MSPSTDRVRTNIVTTPPGGIHLNSQSHSDSTARAPLVGQHITPVSHPGVLRSVAYNFPTRINPILVCCVAYNFPTRINPILVCCVAYNFPTRINNPRVLRSLQLSYPH